jgi:serine/threonine-protein kinase
MLTRSYRLVHPIAEGGMSHVWVAVQTALERRVAVKILTDDVFRTAAGRELFEREARATARVDHPHVVKVVDYSITDDGVPFLVLELLSGETLAARVTRRGPITLAALRAIMEQTCDALACAHESGILHRDIKAENLFLQRRDGDAIDLKLLDFGVAMHRTQACPAGIVGTPAYMSPEQMTGAALDERCDLFSLGVCAYYALSGRFPYPGDTVVELTRSLTTGVHVPISKLRSDVPASLDAWFARALATSAADRFESARHMRAAFESALSPERDTPLASSVATKPRASPVARFAKLGALAATAAVIVFARVAHKPREAARAAPPPPPMAIATSEVKPEIARAPVASVVAQVSIESTPAIAVTDLPKPRKPPARKIVTVRADPPPDGIEGFGNRE